MKIIDRIPKNLLDATNDFAKNLEWSRRKPIYEIHKWWARRYSGIVRLFLIYSQMELKTLKEITDYNEFVSEKYYNPPKYKSKTLLDPFCGGGTILLESGLLGFNSYGIEINKLAYNIVSSYKELNKINLNELEREILVFSRLNNKMLWSTKCKKEHESTIIHTFLSWVNNDNEMQIKYNEIKRGNKESIYFCEVCKGIFKNQINLERCPICDNLFNKEYEDFEYNKIIPFAIEYYCSKCNSREIKKISDEETLLFYCNDFDYKKNFMEIPNLNETNRLLKHGFNDFGELLSNRQKITFEQFLDYFDKTPYREISRIVVSNALRSCSFLAYYSNIYRKIIPGFTIKSYWLPKQPTELNPNSYIVKNKLQPLGRGNIISAFNKIVKAKMNSEEYNFNFNLFHGPSQDILNDINVKFDIVFTDPPYADFQYYSDLSLFNLALLREVDKEGLNNLVEKEVVMRDKKSLDKYKLMLTEIFSKIKTKLSYDSQIIVTYHHTNLYIIRNFLEIFKTLDYNLDCIYPVMGESSGKISKRKIYLDLLFVFSERKKDTITVNTNTYISKSDFELMEKIPDLIDFYNEL